MTRRPDAHSRSTCLDTKHAGAHQLAARTSPHWAFWATTTWRFLPGRATPPACSPGLKLKSLEMVQMSDVFTNVNDLTINTSKLLTDVDDKVLVVSDNANKLHLQFECSRERREPAALSAPRWPRSTPCLPRTGPAMKSTLANLDKASAKIGPAIDSTQTTIDRANKLVGNMDAMLEENRTEIHDALVRLRESLVDAQRLMGDIDETLITDRPDLDETLANIRAASQNLRQFTDTVKQRPYSLIRIKPEPDRVPPGKVTRRRSRKTVADGRP